MPAILLYYLGGLALALAVGVTCYYAIGHSATPLLRVLFGAAAGQMWGRLFRISVVTVGLVGALTTKFYGCGGPTDYAGLSQDHERMFERTTEQVAGSLKSSAQFLLLVAGVGALALAVHQARRARNESRR